MTGTDRVLLADIGGTNARFALADTSSGSPLIVDSVEGFSVADFPSLADAAKHTWKKTGAVAQNGVLLSPAASMATKRAHQPSLGDPLSRTRAALGFDDIRLVKRLRRAGHGGFPADSGGPWWPSAGAQCTPAPASVDRTYAVIGPGTGWRGGLLSATASAIRLRPKAGT